jgi:hypothetical protein
VRGKDSSESPCCDPLVNEEKAPWAKRRSEQRKLDASYTVPPLRGLPIASAQSANLRLPSADHETQNM